MLQEVLKSTYKHVADPKDVRAQYKHVHLIEQRAGCKINGERRRESIKIEVPDNFSEEVIEDLYAESEKIRAKYPFKPILDFSKKLRVGSKVPYLGKFKDMDSGSIN